jgi:hypothetical protein
MNILVAVNDEVADALVYWLHSQGHHTHTKSATSCQKLVLDYATLKPFLQAKQPIPDHWPEAKHWLLLDALLNNSQLISAMHMGCRHISLAPIQPAHLQQWLDSQPQIIDLACKWLPNNGPKIDTDPMLLPFINCLMTDVWPQEQQKIAAEAMLWRNVALQSEQYKKLNKAYKLDTIEFAQLAYHTVAGEKWLQHHVGSKAALIARQHHEHWDASGYPLAIAGDAICLEARLAKLYDSYVGLRRDKNYAQACDHSTSIYKLAYGDGYLSPSQFDPVLLERLLDKQTTIEALYSSVHLPNLPNVPNVPN